jgi:K+-transporting ATPase KdpF subunit
LEVRTLRGSAIASHPVETISKRSKLVIYDRCNLHPRLSNFFWLLPAICELVPAHLIKSLMHIVAIGLVATALLVYLFIAMIWPEKF